MATDTVHLIGAGGHGRVVADALIAAGHDPMTIFVRDGRTGLTMLGRAVATPEIVAAMTGASFHVAVGPAAVRERLYAAASAVGAVPLTVVHPAATVSLGSMLGKGVLVAATAVVAPGAMVGDGTIVNHGAVIDHDCRIGKFCHIAPHATLGGGVTVGDRVLVGSGATLLPGLSIADDVTIGAGAVVLRSIGGRGTWAGNPARRLDK